jgi:hypothetical protein
MNKSEIRKPAGAVGPWHTMTVKASKSAYKKLIEVISSLESFVESDYKFKTGILTLYFNKKKHTSAEHKKALEFIKSAKGATSVTESAIVFVFNDPFDNDQVTMSSESLNNGKLCGESNGFGIAMFVMKHEGLTDEEILERVYAEQGNNLEGTKRFDEQCTLSVGDVILVDMKQYVVSRFGFNSITKAEFKEWQNTSQRNRRWLPMVRNLDIITRKEG